MPSNDNNKRRKQNEEATAHLNDTLMDDAATVGAENTTVDLIYTRLTLVLKVTASTDARATTRQLLQDFLKNAQQIDRHVAFLSWFKNNTEARAIIRPADVSSDFQLLQSYFPRLNPKQDNRSQTLYVSVFLRHTDDLTDLTKALNFWLTNGGHKIYTKPLQCEKTVEIAWLQYSTRNMDKDLLAQEIVVLRLVSLGNDLSWN